MTSDICLLSLRINLRQNLTRCCRLLIPKGIQCALTKFSISDSCAEGFSFTIHPRQGSYEGAPDNGHDVENNSIPNSPGMAEERDCTILIAHRISTVERMDKILFLENGRLEAVGPHEELYATCPEYRKMVDLQKLEEEGGQDHA